ncbi:RecA family ATPase Dmc1 [Tribonema minus]|uniref:RecA family ATPase Dmc1 n=1 Tax=Tribonema minus TaxID=303371 RepID=A0A835YT96_9STRA|nr:RecA family ATPase Dmc1 [Tribonema minus]
MYTKTEHNVGQFEFVIPVEVLAQHGIDPGDIHELRDAGIATVGLLRAAPLKILRDIRGFSEKTVAQILQTARKVDPEADGIMFRKTVMRITTDNQDLDSFLGGGVATGSITEFPDKFWTCKTHIIDGPAGRGCGGCVVFIDTENVFKPELIGNIAKRFGVNGNEVLKNLYHCQPDNHEQQMDYAINAAGLLAADSGPVRLIIVDSITLWRTDLCARGELAERQQKLIDNAEKHRTCLNNLAQEFNLAVMVVKPLHVHD